MVQTVIPPKFHHHRVSLTTVWFKLYQHFLRLITSFIVSVECGTHQTRSTSQPMLMRWDNYLDFSLAAAFLFNKSPLRCGYTIRDVMRQAMRNSISFINVPYARPLFTTDCCRTKNYNHLANLSWIDAQKSKYPEYFFSKLEPMGHSFVWLSDLLCAFSFLQLYFWCTLIIKISAIAGWFG